MATHIGEEPPDLEVQNLVLALNKSGVSTNCPSCGEKRDWTPFVHPVGLPLKDNHPDAVTVLAMSCNHCGFVRLHTASVLDQYMDPRG
jgi:hypothetical protein